MKGGSERVVASVAKGCETAATERTGACINMRSQCGYVPWQSIRFIYRL